MFMETCSIRSGKPTEVAEVSEQALAKRLVPVLQLLPLTRIHRVIAFTIRVQINLQKGHLGLAPQIREQNGVEVDEPFGASVAAALLRKDFQDYAPVGNGRSDSVQMVVRLWNFRRDARRIYALKVTDLAVGSCDRLKSIVVHPLANVERMFPHTLDGLVDDCFYVKVVRVMELLIQALEEGCRSRVSHCVFLHFLPMAGNWPTALPLHGVMHD
jgi:hypothetical protein